MSKPTYYELLRRPEWQRKRLEIMERDGFACVNCKATDKTLNVHHGYYRKDAMPWDYDSETLVTLCEKCHETRHFIFSEIKEAMAYLSWAGIARIHGYVMTSLVVESYVHRLGGNLSDDLKVMGALHARGIADAWGVDGDELTQKMPTGTAVTFSALCDTDWKTITIYENGTPSFA